MSRSQTHVPGASPPRSEHRWLGSKALNALVLVLAFLGFGLQAWLFQDKLETAHPLILTDFNDYHVVGRMVFEGRAAGAYDWSTLKAEQIAQTGAWAFMPWAYPPLFMPFVGVLGALPLWAAYLLFVGGSWVLFQTALVRLTGRWAIPALFVALPAVLINAKCGQSGFLSAGLLGCLLVGLRDRASHAGWSLGAMIFKPHLAFGVGLLTLLERQWPAIARAAVLVLALSLAATALYGVEIWPAFQKGSSASSHFLWTGAFPLERMTSVFAALHRFGVSPGWAMILHLVSAAAAALLLVAAWRHSLQRGLLLALAVAVTLAISPYTYDYDCVSLALIAGLALPHFVPRASRLEIVLALGLSWAATANYLWIGLRQKWYGVQSIDATMELWTISPIALAALAGLVVWVLRR